MKGKLKYILFFLMLCSGAVKAQWNELDSLARLIKTSKPDSNKVNIYNLCAALIAPENPDSAIYFSRHGLNLALEIKWLNGVGQSYHQLASYYAIKSNYPSALELNNKAMEAWLNIEKISDEEGRKSINSRKSKTLGNIGSVYQMEGNYERAIDFYFRALKIDEALMNKKGIATKLGNIGLVYKRQGQSQKARLYYLRSLKLYEGLADKKGIAFQLNNIGNADKEIAYKLMMKGKNSDSTYRLALSYFLKALALNQETGNRSQQSVNLGNIGGVYHDQSNYTEALKYYFTALKIDEQLNDVNGQARLTGNIGSLYMHQKKYSDAAKYLFKARELSISIGAMNLKMEQEEYIKELFERQGNYKSALEFYKLFTKTTDSLFNADKNKELTRHELNYEFEKRESAAKAEQEKKDAVSAAESKKQKLVLALVCFVLILVFIFGGFILRSLHITKKQKALIEIKNKETEEQKKVIEDKNKDIIDSIRYAKRIQTALLPTEVYLARKLKSLQGKIV